MNKKHIREVVKNVLEGYYMPVYEPKVKDLYDNTPYEERRIIMTTIFYPEDYAVYNYGELPNKIQTAINQYFSDKK
jgi:hypothetical protein